MKKRILSILLMCCMVLTLLPVQALAEDSAYTVGEDTGVSARALARTAGTKLKADNIATYIANGLGGGVYTLAEDVTISGTLRVTGEATVDLNGYVLRYAEEAEPGSIFRVAGGKTLTMTDSRPAATHEDAKLPAGGLITGGEGYRRDYGAGQSYSYYGGGVYVEAGASFVLAGGTIYACGVQSGAFQAFGGGIYAEGGSVTMTGGAIRNCAVSADYGASGGAIYAKAGSVTMSGGVISGCSAMDGGGISASGCTVQITGGRIENCKASEHSGGLYIGGHADQISVLDAAISGCEAKRGGGVALIAFAELELGENARITGCTATEKDDTEAGAIEYGAAIYMDLDSTYTVNYPGCFLYANGGRVEGTVYVGTNKIGTTNNYLDSVKATDAIDHTDGKPTTVFTGDVYCEGDIRGGSFHGSVTVLDPRDDMADVSKYNYWKFCSNLSGGSFYKPVRTECHVSGGTFYGGLTLEKNAKLSGKPMNTGSELTDKTNIPNPNGTPVTVTYAYGALGGTYATQIVQAGETAIRPDDPKREGYQFIGWDKAIPATMPAENITVTAQWEINRYTITFDTAGGSEIAPITQDYGTNITAPANPTRKGYTFKGWDKEIPETMPAENITVKAQWEINQYAITFDTNGGSEIAPITQDYGTKITAPADPTRKGYTFIGWDRDIPEIMPAENITVTAQWEINRYTITFDTAGGSEIAPITQDYGTNITAPADPTREGYTFIGWDKAIPTTMPAENITVTAQWKDSEKPTGEIKINENSWKAFLNNITFGLFFKDTQTVTINAADNSGETVTVEYLLSDKELTKAELDGMTFTVYTAPFGIDPDNEYIIYVRLTDNAGNTDYICSDGIVLDGTSPVITGIEDGKTYCAAQIVTVDEKYIDTVKVSGNTVTLDSNNQFTLNPAEGEQTIVVTDKAGNETRVIVTVNDGHTYEWQSENGQYWQKCKFCNHETAKKDIPTINISGADKVCRTQDYKFSFTLPEGATDAAYGYEFIGLGDGPLTPTFEGGMYCGVIKSAAYPAEETGFKLIVSAKTADGFEFSAEKTVAIQNEHSGGTATCTEQATCEICGEKYGDLKPHSYSVKWSTGEASHWHECTECRAKTDEAEHTDTNKDHKCDVCDKVLSECTDTNKDHKCDLCGKALSEHSGGKATCKDKAKCEFCGESYGELNANNHSDLKHFPAVAATKTAEGNIEYWYCSGCKKYYKDATATQEIKQADTVTAKLPGGTVKPGADKSPQTGDNSNLLLWIALLFISGGAAIGTTVVSRKKKYNR